MDPLVRYIYELAGRGRPEAEILRTVTAQFGQLPGNVYGAARQEAARVRQAEFAIRRGPAAQYLQTAMGAAPQPGQEVRIPVVYEIYHRGSGTTTFTPADVLAQPQWRLHEVRAEVNVRGVDIADQSDGDLVRVHWQPGAYYGPLRAGAYDPTDYL